MSTRLWQTPIISKPGEFEMSIVLMLRLTRQQTSPNVQSDSVVVCLALTAFYSRQHTSITWANEEMMKNLWATWWRKDSTVVTVNDSPRPYRRPTQAVIVPARSAFVVTVLSAGPRFRRLGLHLYIYLLTSTVAVIVVVVVYYYYCHYYCYCIVSLCPLNSVVIILDLLNVCSFFSVFLLVLQVWRTSLVLSIIWIHVDSFRQPMMICHFWSKAELFQASVCQWTTPLGTGPVSIDELFCCSAVVCCWF